MKYYVLENGWKTPAHAELERVAVRMRNIRTDILDNFGHTVTELPVLYLILKVAVKCDIYVGHAENAIERNRGGPGTGGPFRPITAAPHRKGHALLPRPRRKAARGQSGRWARRRLALKEAKKKARATQEGKDEISEEIADLIIE